MSTQTLGNFNSESQVNLGNGARFWVYISPVNDTAKMIKKWEVKFSQGDWSDTITDNNPTKQIQTNGLSGIFKVSVKVLSGSTGMWQEVPPQEGSTNEIGCNSNCASFVGIVADSENPPIGSINAHFWTTWDAICARV